MSTTAIPTRLQHDGILLYCLVCKPVFPTVGGDRWRVGSRYPFFARGFVCGVIAWTCWAPRGSSTGARCPKRGLHSSLGLLETCLDRRDGRRCAALITPDAGKVWEVEKWYNREFWINLLLDVYTEHKARFPWYWLNKEYIKSLETIAERQAAEAAWPQPKKRDRKKRSGAEKTETSMTRPAPYSICGSGSSSLQSQSSHSSSSSFPTPTTTSHVSPSAAPLLSTPTSFPAIYPSAQHTVALDSHAGWQASGVQVVSPMFPSVNHSLNGGQYMASIQPAPVGSSTPLDTQVQSHGTAQAEMCAAYYWESRTVLCPSGPYRDVAFCHGARTICVGGDPLSQAAYALSMPSHRSVPSVSGVAYTPQPFQNAW